MAEFKEISPNASAGAKLTNWFENRFPTMFDAYRVHMSEYYAPKNFNFWYIFGSLALLVLVIQIVTGIFLVMHYKPDAAKAFESVEYIMRDVPWGQMSYWGAQVIVNLFSAIPFIGPDLALLIRGDYVVGDATLNRFFSFHVIAVPLVLLGLVVAHLLALHDVGSNNPDGIEIKKGPKGNRWSPTAPADGIPFHPYYSVHDIFGVCVFLMVFTAVIFFAPEAGGYFLEYNNFIPADPMVTPAHIAPVWYFTPYYSMLRAITTEMVYVLIACVALGGVFGVLKAPGVFKAIAGAGAVVVIALMLAIDAKFWGVVIMGGAVIIMFFLPWLDCSPARSIRYRPTWHKYVYAVFVVNFVILAYLGVQAPSPVGERVSQVGTLLYFGFFLLMPWWSAKGEPKPVPDRVIYKAH